MKKTAGYSINPADNTITLTKAYAKLAYTPGTKEFREFSALTKAYPHLTVAMRTANVSEDKEKHGGLTIARMEFIIKNYVGDEIALAILYKLVLLAFGRVAAAARNTNPAFKKNRWRISVPLTNFQNSKTQKKF